MYKSEEQNSRVLPKHSLQAVCNLLGPYSDQKRPVGTLELPCLEVTHNWFDISVAREAESLAYTLD
jgi:hypothetical protein